jgi:O-antigen/teichoic acid export membrane protein
LAIFDFSVALTMLQGAGMIIRQMDIVVIGFFHPPALIAYYAVGSRLLEYATAFVNAISYTITPRMSALQGGGDLADAHRLPLVGGRLASLVLLPIIVTFLIRGSSFIGIWMGDEYAAPSGAVLWILSVSLWSAGGHAIATAAFLGLNKHRELLLPTGAEALANLGLSLMWVVPHGIVGVAWGTTIPAIVLNLVWLPRIYARVLGVSVRAVYVDFLIRPSLAIVPFALGSAWVEWAAPAGSLLVFFAQVAMVLPLALLGAWFIGLTRPERSLFRTRLPSPFTGTGGQS